MNRSTRRRHHRTDLLTTAYMNLRKSGTPQFVTAHEAYRMTDGRVGTKSDHNLQHGFGLMRLVEKADGDIKPLDKSPENCDHDERLPIPGLPAIEACMDCGGTFSPEPVPPLAEQGKILRDRLSEDDGTVSEARAEVQPPKSRVPALSLLALNRMRVVDLRSWAERQYDTTFKSRMRKAEIVEAIWALQNDN